jgi:hypothetical protein
MQALELGGDADEVAHRPVLPSGRGAGAASARWMGGIAKKRSAI